MLTYDDFVSGTHGDFRKKINSALGSLCRGRTASIFDYIPANQHAAIIAKTSAYDIYADLISAIAEQPSSLPGAIIFPSGEYNCNSTVEIKKQVNLSSFGPGMAGTYDSVIRFPADVAGFIVHSAATGGTPGDGTIFSGIGIGGSGGVGNAHGVQLRARAILSRCGVGGFSGDGIHIAASAGVGGAAEGNANNFRIEGCSLSGNGGNGLYADGADANAGIVIATDSSLNQGWGFYDSSFLGNTYIGCHTAGNVLGPYKSDDPNGRSVFIGCYSEQDQPASDIRIPAMVIGGAHGLPIMCTTGPVGGVISDTVGAMLINKVKIAELISVQLIELLSADSTDAWRWKFSSENDMLLDFANLGMAVAFRISGPGTSFANGNGRTAGVPYAFNPQRLFIGDVNPRYVGNGTAAPASGEWASGDIVLNSAPSEGGFAGWICTTGGAVGAGAVFKTFGAISA